jgi:hypothetical protein
MKKFYLFFCLLLTGFISHAQIAKGTILLGGNLEYNESSASSNTASGTSSNKATGLGLSPSFGKAIKDNLVLGFDVTYTHNTNSEGPGYSDKADGFGAGVFLRKYKPLGNGFYLFGQSRLGGNYSHGSATAPNTTNEPVSDITNGFGFSLQFYPGIAYAINRRWQLEIALPNFFELNYNNSKETVTYTGQSTEINKGNNFGVTSALTDANEFTVGIRYFISGAR